MFFFHRRRKLLVGLESYLSSVIESRFEIRGFIGAHNLEGVLRGFAQFGDFLLLGLDQRVKLRDFRAFCPCSYLRKPKIRPIFRAPAVEEEFVLPDDGLAQQVGPYC